MTLYAEEQIMSIEKDSHSWSDIKNVNALGKDFIRELEEFFVNYHKLSDKQYRVVGLKGPGEAQKLANSKKQ